ncbi:MAG: hypothetical protein JO110_06170 [Acetobacteraceae bacterium]|nr:hypothetical protein [Acetobacteraceae bacterium]
MGLAAAWIVIGIGMGFGLYEAAFATVASLYGRSPRNAITGITLFGGLASTVGWPTSAFLIGAFGWRGACLTWAALHLLLGLPLNRLIVPKVPPGRQPIPEGAEPLSLTWTMIVLASVFGATPLGFVLRAPRSQRFGQRAPERVETFVGHLQHAA